MIKPIDWTKKLRFENNRSFVVEVMDSEHVVGSNSAVMCRMYHPTQQPRHTYYGVFDRETGECLHGYSPYDTIVNVPESPRDSVILYRHALYKDDAWECCKNDDGGVRHFTRDEARKYRAKLQHEGFEVRLAVRRVEEQQT